MKSSIKFLLLAFSFFSVASLWAQNTLDTRMLKSPAISQSQIAFIYAEDLWVADRDGSNPSRLTIDEGVESDPVFSPDGSLIAFSAEYDGNMDVFVVSAKGGVPKRLTWHPSWDDAKGFTPDGQKVLFNSRRSNHTTRHAKLYTVGIAGGQPEELLIPTVYNAAYSPDGRYIAYTPNGEVFNQWKNYRGGTQGRIWIYDVQSHEVIEVPKPETGGNDANPQWIGAKIYFRSDRNGEFNLFEFDPATQVVKQLTKFTDFPVLSLCTNGGDLIYDRAGYLYLYDTKTGESKRIQVGIATDLLELRSRYVSGNQYIRSADVSPSGVRAVFDFRGEVVTVPVDKGEVEYLTQTPGVHEKFPAWSPDAKYVAYFSDESGEYALHLQSMKDAKVTKMPLPGSGFYADIHWSPDAKKLCFVDNARKLYIADVNAKRIEEVAADVVYVPGDFRDLYGSWSGDSEWLAYTIIKETNFEQAYVYSLSEKKSYELSDGMSSVSEPTFDPSGKYLYMFASTDAGPVVNWFDQSNRDMEMSNSIYLITLQKDLISPLAKENDEEEIKEEESSSKKKKKEEKEETPDSKSVTIDWEGIQNRIISLPIDPGMYSSLASTEEGKIYYLARKPHASYYASQTLKSFDLKERKESDIAEMNGVTFSTDGKKMLSSKDNNWFVSDIGSKPEAALNTGAIKVKIEPRAEWSNIFYEAWRVNRDYFYDPGMHGLDWEATKAKYEVFLPDLVCRSDLYTMMEWMFSELAVGHHRFQGRGDRLNNPEHLSVGLLGADYTVSNNRYRFAKIYGGLNWNPNLRSPLTEPGVNVKVGEYLITVDGKSVTADQNLYSFFEDKAGKIVKLTVGLSADGSSSRSVEVVPVGNEIALRNRDWIEGNIKKVDEATNGQVAYVYVPNTAGAGHEYFKRYFFPQVNKKAVIIDERYNGGGLLADYYIDLLNRPYQASWNFRYGQDQKAPNASIQGPKVMIIDEGAGSGGDYLPWMFRKFGIGPLVGKRTWGGLVGILGYPEFIDGGRVTAPNVAFYSEKGYRVENEGVAPDIEVEQWPKEVINGHDPQLEKAIEVILEEMKKNTPSYPKRPEYPVRIWEQD